MGTEAMKAHFLPRNQVRLTDFQFGGTERSENVKIELKIKQEESMKWNPAAADEPPWLP